MNVVFKKRIEPFTHLQIEEQPEHHRRGGFQRHAPPPRRSHRQSSRPPEFCLRPSFDVLSRAILSASDSVTRTARESMFPTPLASLFLDGFSNDFPATSLFQFHPISIVLTSCEAHLSLLVGVEATDSFSSPHCSKICWFLIRFFCQSKWGELN